MIIESLFNLILSMLKLVFGILPSIPNLPTSILSSIDTVFNTIFNNLGLLGFFVRISTLKILVPLILIVINFDKIYHFTMWLVKKLPVSID